LNHLPYLCAFDLGTTGVKAGILTPDGRLLASAYREYGVIYPGPLWVEQSIDLMWKAQCEASRQVIDCCNIDPHEIAGVAISSQRATFVPLDRQENPLTRFIGWQDKRSLAQCDEMERRVGSEHYYRIAGLPSSRPPRSPRSCGSKRMSRKSSSRRIGLLPPRCAPATDGRRRLSCDLPDAAYLGLLDVDRLEWSRELLDALEIPREKMPSLSPSGMLVGEVSPAAAEATGLAAGTPLVTAGGDLQTAGLGMGISQPGLISVGIGTGGGVLIYLEQPLRHPGRALIACACRPRRMGDGGHLPGVRRGL